MGERTKRARRRVETGALELALDLVETWLLDLAALAFGAVDLIRNCDRLGELWADAEVGRGADASALRRAVDLVEDTRQERACARPVASLTTVKTRRSRRPRSARPNSMGWTTQRWACGFL